MVCTLMYIVYSLIPCNNGTGLGAINFAFCGGWPDAFWIKPGFVSCVLGGGGWEMETATLFEVYIGIYLAGLIHMCAQMQCPV